jgi:alpha-galactosidase
MLNYTNPMAALCMVMQQHTPVKTVGLCHSVQVCTRHLFEHLGLSESAGKRQWKIAGINHMAWLLEITEDGKDLYPEIKRRAFARNDAAFADPSAPKRDMVRFEVMRHFGYYITESSEHLSEYLPYFIKSQYPELIETYNIPLDEYIRRCINQIAGWKKQRDAIVANPDLTHKRSHEYGSRIIAAMETDEPFRFHGNVRNTGLITNLPGKACVEVACIADHNGVTPTYVGDLPEQLAALNRTNINTQILTVEAVMTRKREKIYQAAMLDPHTSAELPLDRIVALCDDLIEAHGPWLPKFD